MFGLDFVNDWKPRFWHLLSREEKRLYLEGLLDDFFGDEIDWWKAAHKAHGLKAF